MTELLLRDVLKEAQRKEQQGLFIWTSWPFWDNCRNDMKLGNDSYEFALSQIFLGKEATVFYDFAGFYIPMFFAISVQKLVSSDHLLKHILHMHEAHHYDGPITLVPSNEVSEYFQ